MTDVPMRATLNRSGLVRILSEALPDAGEPRHDFGERLGHWLDVTDALALFSALNSRTGATPGSRMDPDAGSAALHDQLARVRRSLSESILCDGVFSPGTARIRFPLPPLQASADSEPDFLPYHRYYLAHQREMSAAIGALRASVRKALAAASPALRQLAELDAIFEKALAGRERHLLGMIPTPIASRFAQRRQEHPDAGAGPAQRGGWLEAFCRDMQAVLLAELDLRLKPVAGLIAALGEGERQARGSGQ